MTARTPTPRWRYEKLDDLPFPVNLVAIVGCLITVAAALLLPRLVFGWHGFPGYVPVVGSLVGTGSALASLELGNAWVRRHPKVAIPAGAPVPRVPRARVEAPLDPGAVPRRARRNLTWRYARVVIWLAVVTGVAVFLVGSEQADDHLLRSGPHQPATVVKVDVDYFARGEPTTVTVVVDERRVELSGDVPSDLRVGDRIQVVMDPHDPTYVLAITSHDFWVYSRSGEIVLGGLYIAVSGLVVWLAARAVPRRAAVRAALRAPGALEGFVVKSGFGWIRVSAAGSTWQWTGSARAHRGARIYLLGDLAAGAWVVLDDGQTHWPRAPIAAVPGTADDGAAGERDHPRRQEAVGPEGLEPPTSTV